MSGGRMVLAVDVSAWLRSGAPTSAQRLFCHAYGRGKGQAQLIPGWPYLFVAALEPGRSSWTALLDAVRLGPTDDATTMTAGQLRDVVARLIAAGHWRPGDPDILIVTDAGYDITRLAFILADLPVEVLGRIRSDRVYAVRSRPDRPGPLAVHPATDRSSPSTGLPPGPNPSTRGQPRRPVTAPRGQPAGIGSTPALPTGAAVPTTRAHCRSSKAP